MISPGSTDEDHNTGEDVSEEEYGSLQCSEETKTIFNLTSLTDEDPFLRVEKERLIQDLEEKQEHSDFYAYRDYIESYPDDNMLLAFDVKARFGTSYFLCLTARSQIAVIQDSEFYDSAEQDVSAETVGDALSLDAADSEEDSDEEQVFPKFSEIGVTVLRKETWLDRPLFLEIKNPTDHDELCLEILPESQFYDEGEREDKVHETIYRKTIDQGFQTSVSTSAGFSQTARPSLCNACTQTELKTFNDEEKQNLLDSDEMKAFLSAAENKLMDALIENASGGFDSPWDKQRHGESETKTRRDAPITVVKSFTCVGEGESKMITSISWHPTLKDVFVVSTAQNEKFEEIVDKLSQSLLEPCLLHIWSVQDQLLPRLLLDSCEEIWSVAFNPSMPHLVCGTSTRGQLVLWDLKAEESKILNTTTYDWMKNATLYDEASLGNNAALQKSPSVKYCACSNIDHGHLLGARQVTWLPANVEVQLNGEVKSVECDTCYQIASCGLDGCLRFWDIRSVASDFSGMEDHLDTSEKSPYEALDMIWKPFHVVHIAPPKGQKHISLTAFSLKLSNAKSVSKIKDKDGSDEENAISTMFVASTEDGKVFQADFNLSKVTVGKHSAPAEPTYYTSVLGHTFHGGPAVCLSYSPFFDDIFLSLGFRIVAIWKEGLMKGPLFYEVGGKPDVTAAHWSPTRPGVLYIGLQDGSFRVWDFTRSSRRPQLLQSIASSAITTITTQLSSDNKYMLALGDGDGFVHILEIPTYLWKPSPNELTVVEDFITREAERVVFEDKKYAMFKTKKAAEAKALDEERKKMAEKPVESTKEPSLKEKESEILKKEYEEFLELEHKILISLGYCDEVEVDEEEDG